MTGPENINPWFLGLWGLNWGMVGGLVECLPIRCWENLCHPDKIVKSSDGRDFTCFWHLLALSYSLCLWLIMLGYIPEGAQNCNRWETKLFLCGTGFECEKRALDAFHSYFRHIPSMSRGWVLTHFIHIMRRSICEQWVEFCSKPLRHSIGLEDLRRGRGMEQQHQLLTPAWSLVLCCCILEAEEEEEEVEGE